MSENQNEERIRKVGISEQMKSAYIDYSMSVIVARALPDVRDGMKPVHRRVLYGMNELGLASNKEFKKSARIVGEVLGKYHPHGDSSVYYAMVRMAQPWSLRYTLVKGQGNYGSVDGDSPAAMRYTEAKLESIAEYLLQDIDKDTVDFKNNFDDSLTEPSVLPARFPNLLVNGASGIAVGMATNMPPHNLNEAIDGCLQYIDNPDITIEELLKFVKAPDFPTGGTIYGYQGVKESYETGRGRIVVRSKTTVEVYPNGREAIIVYEIPYQVNKKELIQRIADLVNEGKLEGISDMRDESNKEGMRIVIELKRDAVANVVLNNLFKHTAMQTSFGVNNIAIVKGRPKALNLRDLIKNFVEFRDEVVIRRSKFDLKNAEAKIHIIEGLLKALNHIDEIIALIKNSDTPEAAKNGLIEKFEFSELQAVAILDMTLRKLTGLEGEKLLAEFNELKKLIEFLNQVINDVDLRKKIIKEELVQIKEKYGDERRTDIVYSSEEFNPEDFFADDHMVITISHLGYIKRTSLVEFQTQNRGGVGAKGGATRDEDFIENMFVATMHNTLLLFTEKGRCFWLKVYEIPEGTKTSKGRAIQNILNIEQEDNVKAVINVKTLKNEEYINNHYIILATKKGIVKKSSLEVYSRPRQNGVNAVTIKEGDQLIEASLTNGKKDILLGVRKGKAIRFPEAKIRVIGRTGAGVKGVTLSGKDDEVVGMVCTDPTTNPDIMVVSENGFGKRTKIEDYRITNRGGKGVKTINVTEKTGDLIAIKEVNDSTDLMIINKSGIAIRFAVVDIRTSGRATQGVKLINLKGSDSIAAIATAKDFLPEVIDDGEGEFNDDAIEGEVIESSVIIEPKEENEEN